MDTWLAISQWLKTAWKARWMEDQTNTSDEEFEGWRIGRNSFHSSYKRGSNVVRLPPSHILNHTKSSM